MSGGNGPVTSPIAREPIESLAMHGVYAFTTTREAGTFGTGGPDPVGEVMGRWHTLMEELRAHGPRFATARQVHGNRVVTHGMAWEGWLRVDGADGHVAPERGTALAVTVADCVPVFLAHPSGAIALLHSGWRGTAAGIVEAGVAALARAGAPARELTMHLGPAICGRCYEVSADVYAQLTGRTVGAPTTVDLRALIADRARRAGVERIDVSPWCTRCHNERFFSHRAGDSGRQLAVMVAGGGRPALRR